LKIKRFKMPNAPYSNRQTVSYVCKDNKKGPFIY